MPDVFHKHVAVTPNDPTADVQTLRDWNDKHSGEIVDTDSAGSVAHGPRGAGLHADSHANTNDPTAAQKAALAGTSGSPGALNPFVTDADPRNSDARTPLAHTLVGALHTAAGLTAGWVVRATGAAAFAWQQLQHGDLGTIGADDHHPKSHGHTGLDSSGTVAHSDTTGRTADDHHPQSHTTPAMTATVAGHVPTPPNDATKVLRGDASWGAVPGSSSSDLAITQRTLTANLVVADGTNAMTYDDLNLGAFDVTILGTGALFIA